MFCESVLKRLEVKNPFRNHLLISGPRVRVPGGPPLEMTRVCEVSQALFSWLENRVLQRICKEFLQNLVT
jgi:hypothetical protein